MEIHPIRWVEGDNRQVAAAALAKYTTTDPGRFFDDFAAISDPHRIEWSDLAAVSALSVPIPAEVADWLMFGDGAEQTGRLLEEIAGGSTTITLAEHNLEKDDAANALYALLKRPGMGSTRRMKLMAAKRPHLVPIYDEWVSRALLPPGTGSNWRWWGPWHQALQGEPGQRLIDAVEAVRRDALALGANVERLSVLRVLDIVIWQDQRDALDDPESLSV
jgi:hypothetical protein